MRPQFPPLNCLLAFESTARRASFKLAADELNLTPSAISHQIAKLEEMLEIKLFERSGKQVLLTQAGAEYLSRLSGALQTISAATDDIRKGVTNTLYVHSSPSFASLWLMPRLADFADKHPEISLSLSASAIPSNFHDGLIDIDIRYGPPTTPNLTALPLFTEEIIPMASPQFLEANKISTPEDLIHLPLIQSAVNAVQWRDWFKSIKIDHSPARFAFRFDRTSMALEAAIQNLGIACDSSRIAEVHLKSGKLRPVFKDKHAIEVHAHYLAYPLQHINRPEVVKFLEWLKIHTQNPRHF